MEYTDDEIREKSDEFKVECGCYGLGDFMYDKDGDKTHLANEECNN